MNFKSFRIPVAAFLAGVFSLAVQADPVSAPDTYSVGERAILYNNVSVLANDTPDPGSGLTAVLETGPSSGTLTLDPDGTFTYVPFPGFSGQDTFTYRAAGETGAQTFTVNQAQSNVSVNATLDTTFGSDSDSDNSSITGTMLVDLEPPAAPFSQIQVQDVNMTLADAVSLNFSFAFGFAGVNAGAPANALTVTMDAAGAPSAVDGAGNFSQTGNTLRITGAANVSGTGLAAGQVPEGPQNFDNPVENVDFTGTVVQSGGIITLTIPLTFSGVFPIDANTLTLNLSGTIVATAPVPTGSPVSQPTTVTINVMPVDDAPLAQPDLYYASRNGSLSVASGVGATETVVAAGSAWRYLDDGSDQGEVWREESFDDAAWATGNAQLGYGDGDENQVISNGGDANNVFVTSYFRKAFTLTDARNINGLRVRLLRDDGAVVYINGTEVVRSNMPAVSGFSTFASAAVSGADEATFFQFDIDPAALREGGNVIAVEIHQSAANSSDVSFDLELIATRASGLLANDSDAENDGFTAAVFAPSPDGTATVSPDGSFSFSPALGFLGETSFLYRVTPEGATPRELLPRGAVWRFLADGTDQGTTWRTTGFDDSAWPSARTKIGYGDGDEATEIGFGGNASAKIATVYFRNEFHVADPANAELFMEIRRDDAAAVYLNGTEIFRDAGLPAAATFDQYATAQSPSETDFTAISVPTALLLSGRNVVAVEVHQASPTSSDLGFDFAVSVDLPMVPLVQTGSEWSYLDNGSDQGTAWTSPAFDDSSWAVGAAKFGYGEGNEATVVSFGGDAGNKFTTTYFRRTFPIADVSLVKGLLLRYLADDGIAVYVNGTEVRRDRLAAGAAFNTLASATVGGIDEYAYSHVTIDPAALVNGENTIAVEIHQASAASSDLAFDLELFAAVTASVGRATVRVIDDSTGPDSDNDGMPDAYEIAFGLIVGIDDSGIDHDGDGRTNLQESIAYTNPFSAASVLKATAIARTGGNIDIQFASVPGKTYALEVSGNLLTWDPVPGAELVAGGSLETFTVLAPVTETYWRVSTTP